MSEDLSIRAHAKYNNDTGMIDIIFPEMPIVETPTGLCPGFSCSATDLVLIGIALVKTGNDVASLMIEALFEDGETDKD